MGACGKTDLNLDGLAVYSPIPKAHKKKRGMSPVLGGASFLKQTGGEYYE